MKRVERRGVNALKKIAKKSEEIIQREPTSLPTGGSAYMYCKESRLVNDKIRKKRVLRGEIIRPVCKCKLLRNFLPSPSFRARYFWQIFREGECKQVSANVRQRKREKTEKIF